MKRKFILVIVFFVAGIGLAWLVDRRQSLFRPSSDVNALPSALPVLAPLAEAPLSGPLQIPMQVPIPEAMVEPQPRGDGRVWAKRDYSVVTTAPMGLLTIKKGNRATYSLLSEVFLSACVKRSEICVRFSNGQTVVASPDLLARIPQPLVDVAQAPRYFPPEKKK